MSTESQADDDDRKWRRTLGRHSQRAGEIRWHRGLIREQLRHKLRYPVQTPEASDDPKRKHSYVAMIGYMLSGLKVLALVLSFWDAWDSLVKKQNPPHTGVIVRRMKNQTDRS